MPRDFLSKQPTKFERLETIMNFQFDRIFRVLGDMDSRLTALSRAKVEPKVLAQFISETDKNKQYSKDLSEAFSAIVEAAQELNKDNETMADEQVEQQTPATEAPVETTAPAEAPAEAPVQEETPAV